MTIEFRIGVDIADLRSFTNRIKAESPRLARLAINKALAHSRTVAARKLAAVKGMPVNAVRKRMKVTKANNRGHGGRLTVLQQRVLASSIGKVAQVKRGEASGTPKAGSRRFPGAFIATMPGGHTSIFKRVGRPRLPIKEQGIPLLPEAETIVPDIIRRDGERVFRAEYERLFDVAFPDR